MSDTNILREYLVKLGFKVDQAQMKKWDENVTSFEKRLTSLTHKFAATGVAVGVAVDRISRKMDELYFASKRTGASAENIRAFGYAVSQLGGDAGDAQKSLEAVARNLRNSPGFEKFLNGMGVRTRDAKNNLLDLVDVFKTDLSRAFANMPYEQANAQAEFMGIDENTLMAMRSGEFAKLMDDQVRRSREMGLNADKAAKTAHEYATAMREIEDSVKSFTLVLADNALPAMKEIAAVTREVLKDWTGIAQKVSGPGELATRIYEGITGKALGGGVRLTPEAAARARATGSGLIVDEQGRPVAMPRAAAAASSPGAAGLDPSKLFANLETMFGLPAGILDRMWKQESGRGKNMLSPAGAQGHFQFMPGTAKQYGLKDPNDLNASATAAARYLKDLLAMFGGDINKAVAAYNWGPGNVQKYGLGSMPGETRGYVKNVAGSGVQVTQQTSIVVQGSSDPYATGQAVANQQNRVAQDAIRNFAPLVR